MSRTRSSGRELGLAVLVVLAAACAGQKATHSHTLPESPEARRESIDAFARGLYQALSSGHPESTLVSLGELDALLTPEGRMRAEVWRDKGGIEIARQPWREAVQMSRYVGYCAQGVHDEAQGTGVGLRAPAWMLNRLLLVSEDNVRRSAAWVEGSFVYTDEGFRVLAFSRIEAPRAHHADLELAPCDVEQGIH